MDCVHLGEMGRILPKGVVYAIERQIVFILDPGGKVRPDASRIRKIPEQKPRGIVEGNVRGGKRGKKTIE